MDIEQIQKWLLSERNLRISPAMSAYILAQLKQSQNTAIPIIAGDARTGVPLRVILSPEELARYAGTVISQA